MDRIFGAIRRGCLVLAGLSLLVSSLSGQEEDSLRQGLLLLKQERLPEALSAFDAHKQKAPGDARSYFYSGLALYKSNQLPQALAEFEKATELDPKQGGYALSYGELLARLGYVAKARETLQSIDDSAVANFQPEQLWFFSDILFRLAVFDRSMDLLKRYEAVRPSDDLVPFRKGQLGIALNDLDGALLAFQDALAKTNRKAEANYGIGLVHHRRGELEEAEKAVRLAIEESPSNPEFSHLLAVILLGLEKPEEALEHLLRVEEAGESLPKIYDAIARVYRRLGKAELARQYAGKFQAIQVDRRSTEESDERANQLLKEGQKLSNEGKIVEARSRFESVLEIDPDNWMAHSYLAGICTTLQQWGAAARHLDRLLEVNPESFEANYLMATYLYQRRQVADAQTYAEKARSLQPGFADCRNLLGNIYFSLDAFGQAAEEYSAASTLDPERAEYRLNFEAASRRAKTP